MKVVDLKEYRCQKALEKHIKKLDEIGEEHYVTMNPTDQNGYRNFMRLLKALDEKYAPKTSDENKHK